jgi:citrate synthase
VYLLREKKSGAKNNNYNETVLVTNPYEIAMNHQLEKTFTKSMSEHLLTNNAIDGSLYGKYDVKRGLRDSNGAGVVVGLTKIGDVQGYEVNEKNEKVAIDGKLFYRGIDVEDIVNSCTADDRFGYEETSYLLLFGELPNEKQLADYKKVIGMKRELPLGFARDMILTAPSKAS